LLPWWEYMSLLCEYNVGLNSLKSAFTSGIDHLVPIKILWIMMNADKSLSFIKYHEVVANKLVNIIRQPPWIGRMGNTGVYMGKCRLLKRVLFSIRFCTRTRLKAGRYHTARVYIGIWHNAACRLPPFIAMCTIIKPSFEKRNMRIILYTFIWGYEVWVPVACVHFIGLCTGLKYNVVIYCTGAISRRIVYQLYRLEIYILYIIILSLIWVIKLNRLNYIQK